MEKEAGHQRVIVSAMRAFFAILCLLIGSNVMGAGWNTNAWPSQSNFWFTASTNYVSSTNYWSRFHTDIWTQTWTLGSGIDVEDYPIPDVTPSFYFWPVASCDKEASLTNLFYTSTIAGTTNAITNRVWTNNFTMWTQADMPESNVVGSTTLPGWEHEGVIPGWDFTGWGDYTVPPSGTVTWTWSYNETNTYSQIVTNSSSNVVTNILITTLSGSTYPTNREEKLDIEWVWSDDTYKALKERWRLLNQTNDFKEEAHIKIKPSIYHGKEFRRYNPIYGSLVCGYIKRDSLHTGRENLRGFKSYINEIKGNFVDINYADTSGLFDSYFQNNRVWEWADNDLDGTNSWTKTALAAPLVDQFTFTNIVGFPYEIEITTNEYTQDVFGYVVGSNFVYELTNHTYNLVETNLIKTWFDYTPHHDVAGWTPGLSNINDGVFRFQIEMQEYPTNLVEINDACGSNWYWQAISSTNTNGVVTNVVFDLYDYTQTNLIYSNSFANATIYTNVWTCTNDYIASGFNEGDYGYSIMPDVISQLVWTTTSASYITNWGTRTVSPGITTNETTTTAFATQWQIQWDDIPGSNCVFNLRTNTTCDLKTQTLIVTNEWNEWDFETNSVTTNATAVQTLGRDGSLRINKASHYQPELVNSHSWFYYYNAPAAPAARCECVNMYFTSGYTSNRWASLFPEMEFDLLTSTTNTADLDYGDVFITNMTTRYASESDLYVFLNKEVYTNAVNNTNFSAGLYEASYTNLDHTTYTAGSSPTNFVTCEEIYDNAGMLFYDIEPTFNIGGPPCENTNTEYLATYEDYSGWSPSNGLSHITNIGYYYSTKTKLKTESNLWIYFEFENDTNDDIIVTGNWQTNQSWSNSAEIIYRNYGDDEGTFIFIHKWNEATNGFSFY